MFYSHVLQVIIIEKQVNDSQVELCVLSIHCDAKMTKKYFQLTLSLLACTNTIWASWQSYAWLRDEVCAGNASRQTARMLEPDDTTAVLNTSMGTCMPANNQHLSAPTWKNCRSERIALISKEKFVFSSSFITFADYVSGLEQLCSAIGNKNRFPTKGCNSMYKD